MRAAATSCLVVSADAVSRGELNKPKGATAQEILAQPIGRFRRLAAVNCLGALPVRRHAVGIIGSAAGRGLRQNRALGQPVNRFLRDVAVGVIRQWDRRSDADHTAQQDIQRD